MDWGRGVLVRRTVWVGDNKGHCVGKKRIMIGRDCEFFVVVNSILSLESWCCIGLEMKRDKRADVIHRYSEHPLIWN